MTVRREWEGIEARTKLNAWRTGGQCSAAVAAGAAAMTSGVTAWERGSTCASVNRSPVGLDRTRELGRESLFGFRSRPCSLGGRGQPTLRTYDLLRATATVEESVLTLTGSA